MEATLRWSDGATLRTFMPFVYEAIYDEAYFELCSNYQLGSTRV